MTTRKSVLRSVRLDDDVWAAIKALDCSLNQYLRIELIESELADYEIGRRIPLFTEPSAIDVEAREMSSLDAVEPDLHTQRGKVTTETISHQRTLLIGKVALDDWRAARKPLTKPNKK